MKNKKDNIHSFPNTTTKLERKVEAILFAAIKYVNNWVSLANLVKSLVDFIKNIAIFLLLTCVACYSVSKDDPPVREKSPGFKGFMQRILPWGNTGYIDANQESQEMNDEEVEVEQLYGLHNKQGAELNSHKKDINFLDLKQRLPKFIKSKNNIKKFLEKYLIMKKYLKGGDLGGQEIILYAKKWF